MKFIKVIASAIGIGSRAFVALVGVAGITAAVANYAMTQGSGTNFGSIVVSTVHYAQQLLCDPTTPANCASVKAGNTAGTADVAQVVSDPNVLAAVQASIPAGSAIIGKTGIDQTTPGTTNGVQVNAALPAGTNLLGKTGIDQTTPGTTNGVQVNAALPTGANTVGNVGADPSSGKATPTEAFLALPATTTTQIVALSGSTKTYVTSAVVLAGGTVNVTFKYGTGSNCGTGTTTLNGPWPLTAQAGFSKGSGLGAVMIVPAGQALCITTDASVTGGVDLTYQQF